jgi:hypothetical protein
MRLVRWLLGGAAAGLALGALWGLLRTQSSSSYPATSRAPEADAGV